MVEFISYDEKYPCLCMGTLIIKVDGKKYKLKYLLVSGGAIYHSEDWSDMWAEEGDWKLNERILAQYGLEKYKDEILQCVNSNIPHGCCGGCI